METTFNPLAQLADGEKRALISQLLKKRGRASQTEAPLSYGQKALWFIYRLAPESAAYHIGAAMRIRSQVDVPALRRALQRLINRHPALRTTFHERGGEPVQVVSGYRDVAFEVIELPEAEEDRLRNEARKVYERPFDLERESIFRATLLRRASNDSALLLTVHHIAYDGWSLWLNQSELQSLYAAEAAGKPVNLPSPGTNYFEYVSRQAEMLAGPEGDELWAYWRNQMSCELQPMNLPFDRPRPPAQRLRGASHSFTLAKELTERVKQRARAEDVTVFMFLLSAFCSYLHRCTGQDEIIVGTPTSGQDRARYADVVGYFVNQVVIRADLSGNPEFNTFLKQMRRTALDALAHQEFPFASLVERLQPERDPSYSPLVQVSFVYQKPQRAGGIIDLLAHKDAGKTMEWAGLEVEYYELPQQEGQFDLELEMAEVGDRFAGVFKYNTDLFESESIARMAQQFETLLMAIAAEPTCQIGKLRLLSDSERNKMLEPSNDTPVCNIDGPVTALFEEQAAKTPHAVAVTLGNVNITYGELNARANQVARFLQSRGVGPEVKVGICVDRSIELVIGVLGILKAGGAYVPIDPATPAERLAFITSDSSAPVFVTTASQQASLPPLGGTEIIALDSDWPLIATESGENTKSGATSDTAAYVIYTSGSTGTPKGCVITHRNIVRLFKSTEHWFHFDPKDVWTLFHSFAFDFSVWEIWGALLYGGRLVVVPYETSRSFDEFYRLLIEQGVTVLNQTPSAFGQLIAAEERDGVSPDLKLRLVIFGGEALELQSLRPWFGRHGDQMPQLVNMYGITETTVHVTYRPLSLADLDRSASVIGGPIPDLQLYVLDKYLEPLPIGIPGELHVSGAGLARGYLNRPDLTEARFVPTPFGTNSGDRLYKTGDLARRLADGDVEYLGRLDHQVKVRGFRIELGEIEAAIAKHNEVRHALVIARKNSAREMQLVAYVVPAAGVSVDFAELRRSLRAFLPDYMVPGIFIALDALPLTGNGKIDRAALPEPERSRSEGHAEVIAPRDTLEQRLIAIWERVLTSRPIGVRDNFFDVGGHSLSALRLMGELEAEFSLRLPVAALFQNPTIEGLAPMIRHRSNFSWSPAVEIQRGDGRSPFFFIPGGGGDMVYLTELARLLKADQTLYGMQYRGIDGEASPDTSVEVIASCMLRAIRSCQPSGPYRLGGHCFGGLIAFEVARQLWHEGQTVEFVAIVDAPAPLGQYPVVPADPGQARWIDILARSWEEVSGKLLSIRESTLCGLDDESQLQILRQEMISADLLPAEADVRCIRGLVNVFRANSLARYQPTDILPVPIKLFRATECHPQFDYSAAEDPDNSAAQSTLGWKHFSTHPITVHPVAGNHLTMLTSPNIATLARMLRSYLVQLDNNSSSDATADIARAGRFIAPTIVGPNESTISI